MLDTASPAPCRIAAQRSLAGAGIGLRPPHHEVILRDRPALAWLEVHPENFMRGGILSEELGGFAQHYALSFHAVGLSLGSAHGIDAAHAQRLSRMIERYQPALVSDHLSWSTSVDAHVPDLLPLPYTEEALAVIARNVRRAQDILGRPLLIENPSTYLRFAHSTMSEAAFLAALVAETGCGVLLDLNNLYVSARNAGLAPEAELAHFLEQLPVNAIGEVHLAGHAVLHDEGFDDLRLDDHGSRVCDDVWALFETLVSRRGPIPTLIEWDTAIPDLSVLIAEASKAQLVLGGAAFAGAKHALAR